ncbi:transmembrane protein 19 isoform X2 [Arctopsyche grandis]
MGTKILKPKPEGFLKRLKVDHLVPVIICALAIPLSMSMWLFNVGYSYIKENSRYEEHLDIHPTRWLVASFICVSIATYGLKKKSLSISGAVFGFVVGLVLTIASYSFLACLFAFFMTSSKATKFRGKLKSKLEDDYKEGGQRSWIHVLCNGGMATQLGLLYLLDVGCGERPIDFSNDYRPSWLAMGILGSFACCNGDTWASELGSVMSHGDPFLITTRKKVPCGTNGGITIMGTILSGVGGLVVGAANYVVVVYFTDATILSVSPPQWPILVVGFIGGLFGSMFDSLLGATLQYSGIDASGKIVSAPGKGIKHISGRKVLDNHSVNLISSVVMGFVMPYIAMYLWPQL